MLTRSAPTCHSPAPPPHLAHTDYACLIVGANAGVVGMAKEHLGVALALRIPVRFVVFRAAQGSALVVGGAVLRGGSDGANALKQGHRGRWALC